jgi:mannose-6-phosphate isomerase
MNNIKLYPLQFKPILKERIWGGEKLKTILNKPITSKITGESWEISTVAGDVSIIANGFFEGKPLTELIEEMPEAILGNKVLAQFGTQFPLLFKYLDAREDLSIQVHPNDELAKKRHNSFGKTEMWYIMQADLNARLIVGFKEKSNSETYIKSLKEKTLLDILNPIVVEKGDVFFLETGTVHAIGAGVVVAEIQQTSDITYRLYDFDRKDAQGNTRELHIDLALDAINYDAFETKKTYTKTVNTSNTIVNCQYFKTNYIPLSGSLKATGNQDSFKVLMCVAGYFEIIIGETIYKYTIGDTILLPAQIESFEMKGEAEILEIMIE